MSRKSHDLWQLDASLVTCMIASFSDSIRNRVKNEATCIIDHTFSLLKVYSCIFFTSTNLAQCRLVQSGNSTFYT